MVYGLNSCGSFRMNVIFLLRLFVLSIKFAMLLWTSPGFVAMDFPLINNQTVAFLTARVKKMGCGWKIPQSNSGYKKSVGICICCRPTPRGFSHCLV